MTDSVNPPSPKNNPEGSPKGDPAPKGNVEAIPGSVQDALREAGVDPASEDVRRAVSVTLTKTSEYFGPIPPAEMLADYERLQPGLAGQIIRWADEQQTHRRSLERISTEGAERRMTRGQTFAFIIAMVTVGAAILIAQYAPLAAVAIVAIGVGGPSVATICARIIVSSGERRNQDPAPPSAENQSKTQGSDPRS